MEVRFSHLRSSCCVRIRTGVVAGATSSPARSRPPRPTAGCCSTRRTKAPLEFYETDGAGGIALLSSQTWRTSWTHVVPLVVKANGAAGSGLLLYDQAAGLGAFYATDGQGNLILLSEDATWPDSWTHIVAGHFTDSDFSDLLFYDQSNGVGALYTTNGSGGMDPVAEYHDWRTSWTHIFVQRFRDSGGVSHAGHPVEGRHDVLFYEGFSGYSEIYEVDQVGGLNLIGARDLDPGLPIIVGGSFGGAFASLLAYDQGAGRGLVFDLRRSHPLMMATRRTTRSTSSTASGSRDGPRRGTSSSPATSGCSSRRPPVRRRRLHGLAVLRP